MLKERWNLDFVNLRFYSIAKGKKAILVKPQCFMNSSGSVVSRIVDKGKQDFLVLCDDVDLPLGKVRLRTKGSSGGHKGLESIIDVLGTTDFMRLRLGIGKPTEADLSDYVLSPFTDEELKVLAPVFDRILEGIDILIDEGLDRAQEYLNR